MNILVTGATGQLGRSLHDTRPAEAPLVGTDSTSLDLADTARIASRLDALRPTTIVNAAAYTAVDRAETEPERAELINATAVAALADWCRRNACRLVQLSTDFVFAGASDRPWRPDDPTGPLGVYARTKLAGERAALDSGADVRIVRTSWVYSEHGHNFVKTMLRLGAERDELEVVDDQTGSPTYARNLARMLWALVAAWPDERTWHYADAGETTWCGFARTVFAEAVELGLLPRAPRVLATTTAAFGALAQRPAYSVLDTTRTRAGLGIEPPPWRTALREMLGRVSAGEDAGRHERAGA